MFIKIFKKKSSKVTKVSVQCGIIQHISTKSNETSEKKLLFQRRFFSIKFCKIKYVVKDFFGKLRITQNCLCVDGRLQLRSSFNIPVLVSKGTRLLRIK